MHPSRLEVMRHLEPFVADNLKVLLREPEANWQPADFSPDLRTEEGFEHLRQLQAEARELPEDVLTVLIGDMITEEALPTYASWIFTLEGVGVQGEPKTSWGAWNRGWCGEENRHGDILNRYLYLTGRVNMREVEVTVQNLIFDGGDTETDNDPYRTFIYTSFQEIATRISHLNVGRMARQAGAEMLHTLSARVAGDEQRHARAYSLFIEKFMELDPSEVMLAFQDMMKKKITMPARYMREYGASVGDTFRKFEVVAGRTGVYTPADYVGIVEDLLKRWDIEHVTGLNSAAAQAQDYLCRLPGRYRNILDRIKKPVDDMPVTFRWFNPGTTEPESLAASS